jgi:uncharacterized protein YndB with AHSA1/START domain
VLKGLLYAIAGLLLLAATIVLTGYSLPVAHTAVGTTEVAASPPEVFAIITAFERYPEWRTDVTRVDVEGEPGAGQLVREVGGHGEIPYRVEAYGPPMHLVTRIADPTLPFGGTWTYELSRSVRGTRVTITEEGEVYNPFFRFMSQFVFGHDATIEQYLEDLERRVGR